MARFHWPWRSVGWAIALACALAGCGGSKPPDRLVDGQRFPPLSLTGIDGNKVSVASFQGKFVVLNVWATWCPPCRKELPSLQRLSRTLDEKRFAVIGLSLDQDDVLIREYLIDKKVTYPNFMDRDMHIANGVLGMGVYPDTFFIGPDGIFVGRVVGATQWDDPRVVRALEAAFQGDAADLKALPHAS